MKLPQGFGRTRAFATDTLICPDIHVVSVKATHWGIDTSGTLIIYVALGIAHTDGRIYCTGTFMGTHLRSAANAACLILVDTIILKRVILRNMDERGMAPAQPLDKLKRTMPWWNRRCRLKKMPSIYMKYKPKFVELWVWISPLRASLSNAPYVTKDQIQHLVKLFIVISESLVSLTSRHKRPFEKITLKGLMIYYRKH